MKATAVERHDCRLVTFEVRDERVDVAGDLRRRVVLRAGRLSLLSKPRWVIATTLYCFESADLMAPVEPEAADAVDQHQQRPFAGRVIVDRTPPDRTSPSCRRTVVPCQSEICSLARAGCAVAQTSGTIADQRAQGRRAVLPGFAGIIRRRRPLAPNRSGREGAARGCRHVCRHEAETKNENRVQKFVAPRLLAAAPPQARRAWYKVCSWSARP